MPKYAGYDLGGNIDGSSFIFDSKSIQKLKQNTQIGGNWKIYSVKATALYNRPQFLLISLSLFDGYESDKLLQARIWNHPKSERIPHKNDCLVIEGEQRAKIKNFNGLNQIHIRFGNVKYVNMNKHCNETTKPKKVSYLPRTPKLKIKKLSILEMISALYAWMVYKFDIFIDLRPQTVKCPQMTPNTNALINGAIDIEKNEFLQLLIDGITHKSLHIFDDCKYFAFESEIICEFMASEQRHKTKQCLRDERYEELSVFTQIILHKMNALINIQKNKTLFKYSELSLHSKYDRFPLRENYKKLQSVIIYHILSSSLQITKRNLNQTKEETIQFQKYCVCSNKSETETRKYAQIYTKQLCKLCFDSCVVLSHSLNVKMNGEMYVNVCGKCAQNIGFAMEYWHLYESMLNWDNGWHVLYAKESNRKYLVMLAFLSAVLLRNAHYKTYGTV